MPQAGDHHCRDLRRMASTGVWSGLPVTSPMTSVTLFACRKTFTLWAACAAAAPIRSGEREDLANRRAVFPSRLPFSQGTAYPKRSPAFAGVLFARPRVAPMPVLKWLAY
jgi:hypothetical protein